MKNYKKIIIGLLALMPIVSCSPEDDIKIPDSTTFAFYEQFNSFTELTEGNNIDRTGWTNFAEVGTVKWEEGYYNGTKYA